MGCEVGAELDGYVGRASATTLQSVKGGGRYTCPGRQCPERDAAVSSLRIDELCYWCHLASVPYVEHSVKKNDTEAEHIQAGWFVEGTGMIPPHRNWVAGKTEKEHDWQQREEDGILQLRPHYGNED